MLMRRRHKPDKRAAAYHLSDTMVNREFVVNLESVLKRKGHIRAKSYIARKGVMQKRRCVVEDHCRSERVPVSTVLVSLPIALGVDGELSDGF